MPTAIKFTEIRKRDGRIVPFDKDKITAALEKAGLATDEFGHDIAKHLMQRALDVTQERIAGKTPMVEEIQDAVEEALLGSRYKKTAKAYIIYRDQHAKMRELVSGANVDLVDSYLEKLDWQVRENSNMSYSLQGLNNYLSSEISKIYWMNKIYTPEIAKAHMGGDLHIHDLNLLASYCVGWDLQHLIAEGFRGVPGKAESKPPKHFRSALGQVVNFFYTLQGESAGAQAFSSFDTLLAPFIRYDSLTYKEVKQAMQEFMFNMNVPTRVGFQTPFTNITMDMHPPKIYATSPVVIGGKPQKETYGEFQEEMDMLNKAFFEVMIDGDAKGRPFTFPIPTYNITDDFAWDNPNFEPLWEMTAKYGIPYFANFVNSDMSPDDSRSMCCRLRLDLRVLERRGGGLFGANPLTGSIGVVTINLPRIGYLAKSKEDFFTRLEKLMKIARESLEVKRKVLERLTDRDLYPYTKFYLASVKQRFDQYWANHFSTIGILGMNEACLNLLNKGIVDDEGHAFAESVLDFMRDKLLGFQDETGNHYNLEATPAEGTAYRLAKIDKAAYPDIICANEKQYREGAKPFYTNSTHLPVGHTDDLFEALDLQDSLQTRYTGGTVLHGFIGESMPSVEATKSLVKKVVSQYRLPYFTITPTFSICPTHGYIPGEHFYCPRCDEAIENNAVTAQIKVEETTVTKQ
ncbi:MAG: ribonucleoside triphosphate reductase [Candidatus Azambacteria bacterium]|nr:ribonucleoside triphosphate reductase [Candidatus Azambacteria bacterium]